jgi:hypothetical protein
MSREIYVVSVREDGKWIGIWIWKWSVVPGYKKKKIARRANLRLSP